MLGACATGSRPPSAPELHELDTAFALGRAIFREDVVSARATDVADPAALQAAGVRGWVTTETPGGWQVDFYTPTSDGFASKLRVTFGKAPDDGKVDAMDPPEPLDALRSAMIRAVLTAKTARFPRCDRPYSYVVVPGELIEDQGWYVYLLAAHQRQGEVVIGGHARVHVSPDGRTLLKTTPLSKGCLVQPPPDPSKGEKAMAIAVVTPIADVPLETYVYLSYLHRLPVFVARAGNLIRIDPLGLLSQ